MGIMRPPTKPNAKPAPTPTKSFDPATHPVYDKPVSSPEFVGGTPDWVKSYITQASQKYQIPTMMLSALLKQESGFQPHVTSPAGAIGIAQFMPDTARGMGVDPLDPQSSIMGAAQYLRQGWDRFGKPDLALAAYNAGGGAVQKYQGIPPYKETQNYVKNIMAMAGEPHQSANGPYLDTLNAMKQNAALPAPSQQYSQFPSVPTSLNQPISQAPQQAPQPPTASWTDFSAPQVQSVPRWRMPVSPNNPGGGQ